MSAGRRAATSVMAGPVVMALALMALLAVALAVPAQGRELCTLVVDPAQGDVLHRSGPDCDRRVTPASTFKLALAIIGFDAGLLSGPHAPRLSWRPGDPDWAGPAWREDTDPTRWLAVSVVWYSQRLTHALGAEALAERVRGFDYGNADMRGDPGQDNGLDRAWIGSSLAISPQEQARFLRRLLSHDLPVAPEAAAQTLAITPRFAAGGWTLHGKTGAAAPRRADGRLDRARSWGWFVGWAERAGRRLVFVRLTQGEGGPGRPAGHATRDALLAAWPTLAESAERP